MLPVHLCTWVDKQALVTCQDPTSGSYVQLQLAGSYVQLQPAVSRLSVGFCFRVQPYDAQKELAARQRVSLHAPRLCWKAYPDHYTL